MTVTDSSAWIVWDWNGTLLDDTSAALAAFNDQLTRRGLPAISLAYYRDCFAFPVKPFYARCGIDVEHEDWPRIAREYHEAYARHPKTLNREARAALELVRSAGVGQCILSALRQDLLEAALDAFGIRHYFTHVFGVDNLDGASKLQSGCRLREALSRPDGSPPDAVLVGDALHDQEVAAALSFDVVLCAQGGHSADRLRRLAPTEDTLLAAAHHALSRLRRSSRIPSVPPNSAHPDLEVDEDAD